MAPDPYTVVCAGCGGSWLDAVYDLDGLPADWPSQLKQRAYTLWRYAELYPFPVGFEPVTMGEGWTPLTRAEGLAREVGHGGIWIKDERRHATGSFKDRQAATAVSALRDQGVDAVVLASTGNAAVAYAAYCARSRIKLWLFVTSSVPAEKMRELALYGAEVIKVAGTYDQAKAVAASFAQRRGLILDGGAKSIPCKESMKTIAFEIAEQWPQSLPDRWGAPDWYVQAVSGGIGPLGVLKGFEELAVAGLIDRVPKIAVVQTKGCAPMAQAWAQGLDDAIPVDQPDSLITVLATGAPGMAYRLLKRATDTYGGAMVAVSDGEAFRAMRQLARVEGISMEPAASVAFAGLERLLDGGTIKADESVVVNCSGHTFSAEKYTLEDRYILNLSVPSPTAIRPAEGLATTLEELDERITTIVIIDDNPYDSRLIQRFLRSHRHYRVFEANSPQDGLALVRQRQPDAVLLDLMMPEMDGFEVLDAIKADIRTQRIPVVIVSAKSLMSQERRRLEAYAESVWQKGSFSAKELATHVVDLVERDVSSHRPAADAVVASTAPEFGTDRSLHVLVVDSYGPEARLIRRLLETRPYLRVYEANSGLEALDLANEVMPDLIILDLELSDVSGEAMVAQLRSQHPPQDAPLILGTARGDLDVAARDYLNANLDSIWSKSMLDRSSFLMHIETLLKRTL